MKRICPRGKARKVLLFLLLGSLWWIVMYSFSHHGQKGSLVWGELCHRVGRQSPIDISLNEVTYDPSLDRVVFSHYNTSESTLRFLASNNGYTAIITANGVPSLSITGGGLPHQYDLIQFHFHWGPDESRGSEHTINHRQFPLEVHFVHQAKGEDIPESKRFAVIAALFHLSKNRNDQFDQIVRNIRNIIHVGASVPLHDLVLNHLLPTRHDRFFHYEGSLTTPPCSEQVVWIVFYDTLPISRSQVAEFRSLLDTSGQRLRANNRPVQPRANRLIGASFKP